MTIKDTGAPPKAAPKRFSITVGIHAAEGGADHTDGGSFAEDGAIEFSGAEPRTVAEIASYHEFGLGVPQRSFIRGWFDESKDQMRELLRSQARLAIEGRITTEQAAERVALKAEAGVKLRIRNHISPPLAASTIARKGSSTPLIDKGQLRSAIRGKVEHDG